jgi:hypothetical protein
MTTGFKTEQVRLKPDTTAAKICRWDSQEAVSKRRKGLAARLRFPATLGSFGEYEAHAENSSMADPARLVIQQAYFP